MGKIQVKVDEIITGTIHSTYQLILKEVDGKKRLPIVIGVPEAQSIALAIEKKMLRRPNTHDLFVNALKAMNASVKEAYINRFEDGIFYSSIECELNGESFIIDSRTSDAIAVALRTDVPIFIEKTIIDNIGIYTDEADFDMPGRGEPEFAPQEPISFKHELEKYTLEELESMLEDALEMEDYYKAASIRDEISRRK